MEQGGGSWRLFPQQKEALEYQGDLILTGGTNTGKTRHLCAEIGYTLIARKAQVLVVTHSSTARKQIWNELCYQIERSTFLSTLIPRDRITRGNLPEIMGPWNNPAYFRLSGDGAMLLGLHIGNGGRLVGDEVALWKNESFKPFFSRCQEGGVILLSSVPYGEKGNKFDQMVSNSVELSTMRLTSGRYAKTSDENPVFAFTRWNREDFPPPIWNSREKGKAIRDYGPPESRDYALFVRGEPQRPEGRVFTDGEIDELFSFVDKYKSLRLYWDEKAGSVSCSCSMDSITISEKHQASTFDLALWVKCNLGMIPIDVLGHDYGKLLDPAVIYLGEIGFVKDGDKYEKKIKVRARVEMFGAPSIAQARLLSSFLNGYISNARHGLGMEASGGSCSQPIWEAIVGDPYHVNKDRVSPFLWQTRIEVKGEGGRSLTTKNHEIVKRRLKHHATVVLKGMIRDRKIVVGDDSIARGEFLSHCGSHVGHDFKYEDTKDHSVEALRVMILRYCVVERIYSMGVRS
jgi:hypothetical protein